MKKALLIVGLAAALIGIVYLNLSQAGTSSPFDFGTTSAATVKTVAAERRSISARVTAPGRIAAAQRIEIYSNVPGQVESILVAPGDTVTAGQPLLKLTSKKLDTELRRAQIARERAASDLEEAATNLESAKGSYDSKVRQAQIYSEAKGAHDQAVINERLAQAKMEQARRTWDKWKGAGANMPGQEVWQAKNAFENASIEFDLAKSRTEAAKAKVDSVTLASQDEIDSFRAKYEAARSRHESISKSAKEAEESLGLAQQEVDKLTIHTPIGGTVTRVTVVVGEFVTPGAMNSPGTVLVTVADLGTLIVEADVDETDALSVKNGQKASVTCDALPDFQFTGQVVEVAGAGQKESGSEIAVFLTKVRLESRGEEIKRLRPGLSAHVEIETATHSSALAVPLQAVVERADSAAAGGKSESRVPVVFVVSGSRVSKKQVRTGLSDDTHVEILQGISAGDEVVVEPFRALDRLQDGDRVSATRLK